MTSLSRKFTGVMNSINNDCSAFGEFPGLAIVPADSLESLTGTPKWDGANVNVKSYTCVFHALISPNVCQGKGLMLTSGNCTNITKPLSRIRQTDAI